MGTLAVTVDPVADPRGAGDVAIGPGVLEPAGGIGVGPVAGVQLANPMVTAATPAARALLMLIMVTPRLRRAGNVHHRARRAAILRRMSPSASGAMSTRDARASSALRSWAPTSGVSPRDAPE